MTIHEFLQESRVRRTPTPLTFPAWPQVASCLDEALRDLSLSSAERIQDEEAAEEVALRELFGQRADDDIGADRAVPIEALAPPLTLVAPRVVEAPAVLSVPAIVADVAAGADVMPAPGSGRQVLDQDLRAQHDEDETADELEFFSKQ